MKPIVFIAAALLAACSAGSQTASVCRAPVCAPAQSAYAIEVSPPARSNVLGWLDQTNIQFDADTGGLVVTLPSLIKLSGTVTIGGTPEAGTVVAKRAARIPGRPDLTAQAALDSAGHYTLTVPPTLGPEVYEVGFVPSSGNQAEVPPEMLTTAAASDTTLNFKLSKQKQTFLAGTVADILGSTVKGMQVQALDATSGRVISTTLNTQADGFYNLALSSTWRGTMARLVATPTSAAPAGTPTLTQQIAVGQTSQSNVNLSIPPLPRVARFSYQVNGKGTSGVDVPVPGVHCQFLATVSAGTNTSSLTAIYLQSAVSDVDGLVSVDLVPSEASLGNRLYDVTVSPPAGSDFASQKLQIAVGPTGGYGAAVMLPPRPTQSGRVIDQRGLPVAQVTVQPGLATAAQIGFASSLADLSKLTTTITDINGRFALPLDVGQYDLAFIPPASKLLPRLWIDLGTLTSDNDIEAVVLRPGAMVRTSVVDSNGAPVVGAAIQLFIVPAPTCGGNDPTCTRTPRVLVDTATGSDGSAQMLLPTE